MPTTPQGHPPPLGTRPVQQAPATHPAHPAQPARPDRPEPQGRMTESAAEPREKRILIDFAFKLTVEHGLLGVREMFAAAEAFDFYEVRGVAGENVGKPRRELNVDVLEVSSTATTVHVTPVRPMTYADMAAEMEHMVDGIARHHLPGGKAKGVRVQWVIPNTGIASDMRGRLAVVH